MDNIPCFGLNFLSSCSPTHYTDHFLFNLETAVSSLAIIVAIYALFLERRYRVRIGIKNTQLKNLIFLVVIVIELTFVAATISYIPGAPRPLIGYPIFWEIIAFFLLLVTIFQAYSLLKPIRKFSRNQIKGLINSAPYDTLSYHNSVDLMVKEADYFWADFLKKSQSNPSLKRLLLGNFTNEDFLKVAVKSQYILLQTVEIIGKSKLTDDTDHIKSFLRTFFLFSLTMDNSVISTDLTSSYKDITQHIMRKRKLADVIFGNSTDLFFLKHNLKKEDRLNVLERFVEIFRLYLGNKYHYTEDSSNYMNLIHGEVLSVFIKFFKDSLHYLDDEQKKIFMNKLSFSFPKLTNLPQKESEILANGAYEILETYAIGKDWKKDSESDRIMCFELADNFVNFNKYAKKVFKQRMLEKITGSNDNKKLEQFVYNLKGYYPMMIPVYFFIYGHTLFSREASEEDFEFNMAVLKKMQENLPKFAAGKTQRFLDTELPEDERGASVVRQKADRCLGDMFPQDIIYNKETNSITYIFGSREHSRTLLLNETIKQNKYIFQ